jgi:hypothetical protein
MANVRILTSPAAVTAEMLTAPANSRVITSRFRNPSRMAAIIIPNTAWDTMSYAIGAAGAPYAALLGAVLETAAKAILTRRIENMSLFPSEIDDAIFSDDAILSEATTGNSEWMSKEEITQAWETSATRKAFIEDPKYTANAHYRKAVANFAELVIKLAGKTSAYEEKDLDIMQAKMLEADHDGELVAFMNRRIEQIRNKPAKPAYSLELL